MFRLLLGVLGHIRSMRKLAMSEPYSKRSCNGPAYSRDVFCGATKQLLGSVEVRSFLASVLLIWLTGLFGPVVVFLMVVAFFLGFLLGVVRGPTILEGLAERNRKSVKFAESHERLDEPSKYDDKPHSDQGAMM